MCVRVRAWAHNTVSEGPVTHTVRPEAGDFMHLREAVTTHKIEERNKSENHDIRTLWR